MEARMEAVEESLDEIKSDQRRIFDRLDSFGSVQAVMLHKLDEQAQNMGVFIKQCAACRAVDIEMRRDIEDLKREVSTSAIKRKAGTEQVPALAEAKENDIFKLAGQGFKTAFVKSIEYGVILGFLAGAGWALGVFQP